MNRQYRMIFLMTIPAVALIVGAAYLGYKKVETATRIEIGKTLKSVVNTSYQSLENWLEARRGLALTWADNGQLRVYAAELIQSPTYPVDLIAAPAQARLRNLLLPVLKDTGNKGYFLIGPDDLNLASSRDYNLGFSNLLILQENFLRRVWAGESLVSVPQPSDVPIQNSHGDAIERPATMFAAAPVRNDAGDVIAILAFRLDLDEGYRKILAASRLGASDETYTFDRDGRLLSESRFNQQLMDLGMLPTAKHSSLYIKIRDPGTDLTAGGKRSKPAELLPFTRMAESAVAGKDGLDLDGYRDYRGVKVVGAWLWNENYGFGIATETGFKEAYQTLWSTRFVISLFAAFSSALLIGLGYMSARGQRKIAEGAKRLSLAIENISDGFTLFDADDKLILFNRRFCELYPGIRDVVIPGVSFQEIARAGAERGQFPAAEGRVEEWLAERMALRQKPATVFEERATGGRWIRTAEKAVPGGGRVGVLAEITDLVDAKEEANQANQAKSQFLSSMSHELRTPLNAILGFGQMLEFNPQQILTDDQKNCVDHIMKGGEHLLDLINEVLDLAKIESGVVILSTESISIRDVLDECLTLIGRAASKATIDVRVGDNAQDWPLVRADYTRTKQVLLNLLSNAIKYNRAGGKVFIEGDVGESGMFRIAVRDTGAGIPEIKIKGLFEPFNRLGAENSDIEGTGIGLTITRQLVEMMSGRIGVESVIGQGSTFWVDLPLAEADSQTTEADQLSALAVTDTQPMATVSGKILYIEDNPSNLALMEMIFDRIPELGLITSQSAETGIELARIEIPDIILLDIHLPGMDGYEAFEKLKGYPETSSIPVIALTASATAHDREKGRHAGFRDYLTKPVNVDELMAALDDALKEVMAGRG